MSGTCCCDDRGCLGRQAAPHMRFLLWIIIGFTPLHILSPACPPMTGCSPFLLNRRNIFLPQSLRPGVGQTVLNNRWSKCHLSCVMRLCAHWKAAWGSATHMMQQTGTGKVWLGVPGCGQMTTSMMMSQVQVHHTILGLQTTMHHHSVTSILSAASDPVFCEAAAASRFSPVKELHRSFKKL